jgi:pheromone shutdown protein TraB
MLRLFLSRSNTHNINNTRRSLVSSILSTSCSSYHSQQTVAHLRKNDEAREIFLVGTSHVSKASARETEELIRLVKPDVVAVELCEERFEQLKKQMKEDKEEKTKKTKKKRSFLGDFLAIVKNVSSNRDLGALDRCLAIGLKAFYASLKSSGMEPGEEFRVAIREAERLNARLVLADRDVNKTLVALRKSVSVADIFGWFVHGEKKGGPTLPPEFEKMAQSFDWKSIDMEDNMEAMKNRKAVGQMKKYMEYQFPKIMSAMVHQRDDEMAEAIKREKDAERIVMVVGLAHVDGIVERLAGEYTEITSLNDRE